MNLHSVRTRFVISFAATVLRSLVGLGSGLVVARSLQPSAYGHLTFLLSTFVAARTLLDLGTSTAYYTLLSRQQRGIRFHLYYFGWLALQFVLTVAAIGVVFPQRFIDAVWVGHDRTIILLAFAASFLQLQVWQTVTQLGEAARRTALVQSLGLAISVVHFAAVLLMARSRWLSLTNIFLLLILEYAAAALLWWMLFSRRTPRPTTVEPTFAAIYAEFYAYCRPLALLAFFGFFYEFADRWLLQRFGGAIQQGFFQIASQFSTITLIATSALLNIFWKEIAEASEQQRHEAVEALYVRAMRFVFMTGAIGAGLLIPWSPVIVGLLLGPAYIAAWPVLAIMLLYPIYQSLGQIGGTFLLAKGETRLFATISVVTTLSGTVISYFVQAPPRGVPVPGLGLGATGMAAKIVLLSIITTNVQAWLISRRNRWHYDWTHQAIAIACMAALSAAIYLGVGRIWDPMEMRFPLLVLPMALYTLIYLACVAALLLRFPWLVGVTRAELRELGPGMALLRSRQ